MNKLDALREDLKVEVEHIAPDPQSVLIIRPRGGSSWNPLFQEWVMETIRQFVPSWIKVIFLKDDRATFTQLRMTIPDDVEEQSYRRGWDDAIGQLQTREIIRDENHPQG